MILYEWFFAATSAIYYSKIRSKFLLAIFNSETHWTNRISAKQASKALRHHWRPGTCPSKACSNHANETNTRTQVKNIASEPHPSTLDVQCVPHLPQPAANGSAEGLWPHQRRRRQPCVGTLGHFARPPRCSAGPNWPHSSPGRTDSGFFQNHGCEKKHMAGWWFQFLWKIWYSQLGWLFKICGKIRTVPNIWKNKSHVPVTTSQMGSFRICQVLPGEGRLKRSLDLISVGWTSTASRAPALALALEIRQCSCERECQNRCQIESQNWTSNRMPE